MRRPLILSILLASHGLVAAPLAAQDLVFLTPTDGPWKCGCADVPDLLNRLNMAHAAIDKYRSERPAIRKKMETDPVVTDALSPDGELTNYDALQKSVESAQAKVQDPNASVGVKANTRWLDCKTWYDKGSASTCVYFSLDAHEAVHRRACDAYVAKRPGIVASIVHGSPAIDLIDKVDEEIAAYEAEVAEIRRLLRALPASCRPGSWVGVIQATEVKRLNITERTKLSNPLALESVRTIQDEFNRFGAVRYRGQASTAGWTSQTLKKVHSTSGMQLSCSGGLRTPKPDRTQINIHYMEHSGTGGSTEVPLVLFSAPTEALEYTLSLRIPAMSAHITLEGYETSSGGCQDRNETFSGTFIEPRYEASDVLLIQEPKAPYTTVLEGTKRFDLMPFRVQIPGVTSEHTIEVTWHLHKID